MEFIQNHPIFSGFVLVSLCLLLIFMTIFHPRNGRFSVKKLYQMSVDDFIYRQVAGKCEIQVDAVTTAIFSSSPITPPGPHDYFFNEDYKEGLNLSFVNGPIWSKNVELKKANKVAVFIMQPMGLIEIIRRYRKNDFIQPIIYAICEINSFNEPTGIVVSGNKRFQKQYCLQRYHSDDSSLTFPPSKIALTRKQFDLIEDCKNLFSGIYDSEIDDKFEDYFENILFKESEEEKKAITPDMREKILQEWRVKNATPMSKVSRRILKEGTLKSCVGENTPLIRLWDYPEELKKKMAESFFLGLMTGGFPEISDGKTIVIVEHLLPYNIFRSFYEKSVDKVIHEYKNELIIPAINVIVPSNCESDCTDPEAPTIAIEKIAIPITPADKYDGKPRFLVIKVAGGVIVNGIYQGHETRVLVFYPK